MKTSRIKEDPKNEVRGYPRNKNQSVSDWSTYRVKIRVVSDFSLSVLSAKCSIGISSNFLGKILSTSNSISRKLSVCFEFRIEIGLDT